MKQVIKLLNDNPLSKNEVQKWFLNNLVKTITEEMPKEFQEFVKAQTVDDAKLAVMISEGPRGLFDIFDNHKIYINIVYQDERGFVWDMAHPYANPSIPYTNRKKAETKAIFKAFELLEDKLKPKKDDKNKKEKGKKD
tara:strand:- start:125 stop:538 length:414 start_codon:yes stop_codon:yes gene_type:complete